MSDHIDRIMEVMTSAFDPQWGEAWNRRQISDSLLLPRIHYLLIDENGEVDTDGSATAGFLMSSCAPGEEELLLIAVKPEARFRGLGYKLLRNFTHNAKNRGAEKVFLQMRANNPARSLYEEFGFRPIGKRKDYYRLTNGSRLDAITFGMDV